MEEYVEDEQETDVLDELIAEDFSYGRLKIIPRYIHFSQEEIQKYGRFFSQL